MISPEFLAGIPWMTFGRLRPMHTNGVLFMWLSMAQVGAFLYIVPRLCGTKLHSETLGNVAMILWNMVGIAGYLTAVHYAGGTPVWRTLYSIVPTCWISWVKPFRCSFFGSISLLPGATMT